MPRPRRVTNLEAEKAAVLASEGLTASEIAGRLGVAPTTAWRMLQIARERRWLVTTQRCTLPPERTAELWQLIYGVDLEKALGELPPEKSRRHFRLKVYDCGDRPYVERLEVLGAKASEYVGEQLAPLMSAAGVTWGITLRCLVDELESRYPEPVRDERPIRFFPTCGDPPEVQGDPQRSSSILATRLARCFNKGEAQRPLLGGNEYSFSGVGASIPFALRRREEVEAVWRYFRLNPRYRRIFGDGKSRGLIHECDTLLTSAGTALGNGGPWLAAAAEAMSMTPAKLARLTVGNVGGLFLPRPGLEKKDEALLGAVNDRWTGLRLEHIVSCARAASAERVGVVMIIGGDKTEILLECLRRGLVNHLLIDQVQAAALAAALGAGGGPKRK